MGNAESAFKFSQCRDQFLALKNGSVANINGVTNATLPDSGWIWTNAIGRLLPSITRDSILAITYKRCIELCGNKVELNTPTDAFSIAATWIFPLAILFSLPYDSLHRKKFQKTIEAACNWLGSPQTALTSTIFNFDQIRICARLAKEQPRGAGSQWNDAYYVLSCANQFSLPTETMGGRTTVNRQFMCALVYGLFRPLREGKDNENRDIEMTRRLLSQMATKLRDHRRRGVYPIMFSLGTFLVAFVFSIVLAFAEVGESINVTPLTIGLLYGWLPLLVIVTVVDRNPNSADRTAEYLSRWLHNVDAVLTWTKSGAVADPKDPTSIGWWTGHEDVKADFCFGEFIGQGRRMEYCGLSHAVARTVTKPHNIRSDADLYVYEEKADDVINRLDHRRPFLWWSAAFRAVFLVWIQIMMAFIVAFTSPTVGIGCWSGSFVIFGGLTSFSWVISLFKKTCGSKLRFLCTTVNAIALLWLVFITGLVLSGAMNNCYCNTTWMAYPHSGGYMIFGDFEFVRESFDVTAPWGLACGIGLTVIFVFFVASTLGWASCGRLWSSFERGRHALPLRENVFVSTGWLE